MCEVKILVIDDEPNMLEIVSENLKEIINFNVFTASDAIQGISLTKIIQPDIILLDLNMPAGGGENVYRRLKQMTPTASIPIIVITAEIPERIEDLIEKTKIEKEDIFSKPIDFDLLVKRITLLINRNIT